MKDDYKEYTDKEIDDIFGLILHFDPLGHFLTKFMILWRTADASNKVILKDVTLKFIEKYKLQEKAQEIRNTNPQAREWSSEFLSEVDEEKLLK